MPQEQERFHQAVASMIKAFMFENWIRFYFLQEVEQLDAQGEGGEAAEPRIVIVIPEPGMQRIRERFGEYAPMAERLNGREATLQLSRDAVCDFIRTTYEGNLIPQGSVASYFDTRAFQLGLQLFNIWVQAYEKLLDQQFLDFGQWSEQYQQWLTSEHGQEVAARLDEEMRAQK